jgi:hypothetical protein
MRTHSVGSWIVLAALGGGALFLPHDVLADATFHMAKDGLCNKGGGHMSFKLTLDSGSDHLAPVSISNQTGFDTSLGGTLKEGECATATFTVSDAAGGCGFSVVNFAVRGGDPATECDVTLQPNHAACGKPDGISVKCMSDLHASHDDEHFQIEFYFDE